MLVLTCCRQRLRKIEKAGCAFEVSYPAYDKELLVLSGKTNPALKHCFILFRTVEEFFHVASLYQLRNIFRVFRRPQQTRMKASRLST